MTHAKIKILIIFGTRPEAIKMAPLVKKFQRNDAFETYCCVTGQHREMLDQVLSLFEITPEFDLNIMKSGQTLVHITSSVLEGVSNVLEKINPSLVLVHGDVTTGVAAAMAAFYKKIPVGHVEAGLRTGDIYSPFPEEMNRKLIGNLSTYHFTPTEVTRNNLLKENINEDNILITGNTVIDALLYVQNKLLNDKTLSQKYEEQFNYLASSKKLILVTGHRRENLEAGLENTCSYLKKLAQEQNVQIIYPVHLNPLVQEKAHRVLGDTKDVFLISPLDYLPFVYLMNRAYIIVTDSGGIQEEAPALGKPVLVTRGTTERPEALNAGTVKLVGTNGQELYNYLIQLLTDNEFYNSMSQAKNPYGDGTASQKIVEFVWNIFNRK